MTGEAGPEVATGPAWPTVRREKVTWSRWDPDRMRTVTSHPWQFIVTEPDGEERCFDRRREADKWITDNYPPEDPPATVDDWQPSFSPWRHGGWYVHNVRYPSGACGCVSRNYTDRRWRIACDPRPGSYPGGPNDHTYPSRDAAARAERDLVAAMPAGTSG